MSEEIVFVRDESWLARLVRSPWVWFFFLSLLFTYPLVKSFLRELPPPKTAIGRIPSFSLINQFGKAFGSADLKGRAYLANFAFTACPTTCPALMQNLQKVQKRIRGLGQKVAIVTFSVDPVNDSPEVLFKHAQKYKANPHIWSFLTGEKKEIRELLLKGFKVPMGEREQFIGKVDGEDLSLFDIAHTTKLVLVDGGGGIRGYYSTDKSGINNLMIDLGLLVNRELVQ